MFAAEMGARRHAASNASYGEGDDRLRLHRFDERTVWRYRANVNLAYGSPEFEMEIRTGADGLRDGPGLAVPDTAATVLVIGDSFAFGWGVAVEQSYPWLLERALAQTLPPGTRPRVVNAGHMGYAFYQQFVLMKELIARNRPIAVLQGLYWPQVRSLFNHRYTRAADGTLRTVADPTVRVDERGRLQVRSDWYWHPGAGSQLAALAGWREQIPDWVDFMRPKESSGTRTEELWMRTDAIVGEIVQILHAAGVAYIPFIAPTAVEVNGTSWAGVGWRDATPPIGADVTLPASRLAAMLAQRGADEIDLRRSLRAGDYYPQDGHWNSAGHRRAAEALVPAVAKAVATRRSGDRP